LEEKKNDAPRLTVIVLVYNNGKYTVDTLDSIRDQHYPNLQCIVIDDASKDDSVALLENWIRNNPVMPVTFVPHAANKGICASINEGLAMAEGKYISIIGDDIMLPGKLTGDVETLEKNPDCGFVYSKMITRNIATGEERRLPLRESDSLFKDYISGNITITTPTVMYRRSVFDIVGLFDTDLLFEDYDMHLRVLDKFPAIFRDEYTIIYIMEHGRSIQIQREIAFQNEFFKVLKKWKHLPRYRYYVNNRHQFAFCHFSVRNKREALRHLPYALTIFWKPRLYRNLLRFLFVWK
jgi:glycosyltransferase involved in cell wall biosynthesis